jgi:hypothetical protein
MDDLDPRDDPSFEDALWADETIEKVDMEDEVPTPPTAQQIAENLVTMSLEPNWEQTAKFFATGLANKDFETENPFVPVFSFAEQVVYLSKTDPEAYGRFMAWIRKEAGYGG